MQGVLVIANDNYDLRSKSHMILIEIKIEARYLKKNSQTTQDKNRENLNRSNAYGFSVERDFIRISNIQY